MRSTPAFQTRHRNGSPIAARPRRLLQISPDSPSRLMRRGQRDRCRECGNRIEWYLHGYPHRRPVRLHPGELPAARVPAACRWRVSSGVAYPAGDGSGWCRLIDAGGFTPAPTLDPSAAVGAAARGCRPARPDVQLLYVRYLASRPVEEIRCVAQTLRRDRCTNPLITSDTPSGTWRLMPVTVAGDQLILPADVMAVYDLSRLLYAEQLRWRAQHCPQHAVTPAAADLAASDCQPFDPSRHHEHIHTRLPVGVRRPRPHHGVR